MKKTLLSLVLSCFITVSYAADNSSIKIDADNIVVKTPEVQLVATGATSAQTLIQLANKIDERIKLIAAYSPVAHQTQLQNGKKNSSKMHQVREVIIPAKDSEEVRPGEFHVMLLGLKQTLHKGDTVPVILIFADGSSLQVKAKMH